MQQESIKKVSLLLSRFVVSTIFISLVNRLLKCKLALTTPGVNNVLKRGHM